MNKDDCVYKERVLRFGFFRLARNASLLSTHPDHQLGAVIAKARPISIGCNLNKSHPQYAKEYPAGPREDERGWYTIHAEIKAVLVAGEDKCRGADMYVYREKADGSLGLARPCIACVNILRDVGIKTVYYTTSTGYSRWELRDRWALKDG